MSLPTPSPNVDMNSSFVDIEMGSTINLSGGEGTHEDNDYIYDRSDVRAVCIFFYSIVFIACFFGNLIVILVVTVHWRMRSITNFCLANLAFADFCVSIFCVYQNMYIYFMSSWVFGGFLCKMYYFITELSHTASILILVVICIERYLAIVHPMRCKEWLTMTRLRFTIIGVWSTSAIYSSPRLYFTNVGTMTLNNGKEETLCIPIRTLYDSETFDMISLALLFVFPLLVISVLYTRIALALWESSKNQMAPVIYYAPPSVVAPDSCSSSEHEFENSGGRALGKPSCSEILCCGCDPCRRLGRSLAAARQARRSQYHAQNHRHTNEHEMESRPQPINSLEPIVIFKFETKGRGKKKINQKCTISFNGCGRASPEPATEVQVLDFTPETLNPGRLQSPPERSPRALQMQAHAEVTNKLKRMTVTRGGKYGSRALESRRRIIKMLIIIVFAFAVCNLPFHARKIWQYYGVGYSGGSNFSSMFTPLTFLIMYANSGINPILYAFMSHKFRICFMDLLNCKLRRVARNGMNASVRSTHIIVPPGTPG